MTDNKLPALVIAGPSGVGKGTIIKELEKHQPGVFGFSVSHATRAPREGEVDGKHYNFVSVEKFEQLMEEGYFLEYAKVHTNYYGTSFAAIEKVAANNQLCILDIDVQGARSARRADVKGTYMFISPPSLEELERRLRTRGTETPETIRQRMETTEFEMGSTDETIRTKEGHIKLFDEVICNDILEETVQTILELVAPHIEARDSFLKEAEGAAKETGAEKKVETKEEETKLLEEDVSVAWMATQSIRVKKGQLCVLSATVNSEAKLGIKVIFKPNNSTLAHLLCKNSMTSAVSGFFEPADDGELILEFDNTKASVFSFSKTVSFKASVTASRSTKARETLVNHIRIQDLIDRCPADAADVATALRSALTFSAKNVEKALESYSHTLKTVNAASIDSRIFGVGAYSFS